jgi:hypothetical protein
MKLLRTLRVDSSSLTVASLTDRPDDVEYWHARSPYERLQAVEILRQINYGYDPSTARLQRILEIAQRSSR